MEDGLAAQESKNEIVIQRHMIQGVSVNQRMIAMEDCGAYCRCCMSGRMAVG